MIPQYDNELFSSFILWIDHKILSNGQAYTNLNDQNLIRTNNKPVNTNLNYYGSPQTQWVCDSSITGANIPTGVTADNVFIPRGSGGAVLDFRFGGAFLQTNNSNVTASFAKKDFNVYASNEHQSQLLIERQFNGENIFFDLDASKPNSFIGPCILVNMCETANSPFALGGTKKTNLKISVVAVSDNYDKIVSLNSIFRDLNESCFSLLSFADVPYTRFGDLKSPPYNYLETSNKGFQDQCFVDKIKVGNARKISDKFSYYASYTDFLLYDIRNKP
jgi:hypothetical protein